MTARDARLVLPGEFVMEPGWMQPRRVHHIEITYGLPDWHKTEVSLCFGPHKADSPSPPPWILQPGAMIEVVPAPPTVRIEWDLAEQQWRVWQEG